ncbi:DUF397 domain-containing protein [Streptomyces sp. 8P21H-1]|nr:DUF397 domain-containing protein [Streptomyces sp. 8P21H-1]NSL43181.1 DUF397 domain-containing protein [Streptomyces sp. 8P21H-1]
MTYQPSGEAGSELEWIKSSYSSDDGPSCVEVAMPTAAHILIRDSKSPEGPHLTLTPATWTAFLPHAVGR